MAIKESVNKNAKVPDELVEMTITALSAQQCGKCWEEIFQAEKANIFQFLRETDEVEITPENKSVKIEDVGSITYKAGPVSTNIDKDKLAELVESGRLNIHTLIAISGFKASDLKTLLSSAEYNDIVVEEPGKPQLALTATPGFKKMVADQFAENFGEKPAPEEKPVKKAKTKTNKAKSEKENVPDSLSVLNDALKTPSKSKDVDSDLADILGV